MILIPYKALTYKTHLIKKVVLENLHNSVDTSPRKFSFRENSSGKEYEGRIDKNEFEISRIIEGRNSSLPLIKGIIVEQRDGTIISVRMRLHLFSVAFLVFCGGFIGVGIIRSLRHETSDNVIPLIGMILFIYIMTIVFFNIEKSYSIQDLQRFFEAEIIE